MATATTEESSLVPATAEAQQQQPDLETSIEPGSVSQTEPREAQCDREEKEDEEEEEGGSSAQGQENVKSLDPEWVEERFRIDRKKLETMLYGEWSYIAVTA